MSKVVASDEESSADEIEKEVKVKSFEELEKESREAAEKSLDDLYTVMVELDDTDWFAIFINTMTIQFDPHKYWELPFQPLQAS